MSVRTNVGESRGRPVEEEPRELAPLEEGDAPRAHALAVALELDGRALRPRVVRDRELVDRELLADERRAVPGAPRRNEVRLERVAYDLVEQRGPRAWTEDDRRLPRGSRLRAERPSRSLARVGDGSLDAARVPERDAHLDERAASAPLALGLDLGLVDRLAPRAGREVLVAHEVTAS